VNVRGVRPVLPHGTEVVYEHGSLGANGTTIKVGPWKSSAGVRRANGTLESAA